jgi:hypothetical protein
MVPEIEDFKEDATMEIECVTVNSHHEILAFFISIDGLCVAGRPSKFPLSTSMCRESFHELGCVQPRVGKWRRKGNVGLNSP